MKAFRQSAAARVSNRRARLSSAPRKSAICEALASGILSKAADDIAQSRRFLDARATRGYCRAFPATMPFSRHGPLPKSQPEVDAVPADKRGVSFFSCAPRSDFRWLVPVKVTIDGVERTVMATPAGPPISSAATFRRYGRSRSAVRPCRGTLTWLNTIPTATIGTTITRAGRDSAATLSPGLLRVGSSSILC